MEMDFLWKLVQVENEKPVSNKNILCVYLSFFIYACDSVPVSH